MFVEQLRRAVEASPRVELTKVSVLLWRAYASGQVSEAEASELSERIEARKAIPTAQKPVQRRFGSRPRTPASMERRRRWAASGALPPALAARFTLAEIAVLAVIAAEVLRHSACTLTVGHIAALAGVSETTVRGHAIGRVLDSR
jgi:anti-sigma factor RsiW